MGHIEAIPERMSHENPPASQILLKIDGRYVCADNLRFACMLAIITMHSANVLTVAAAEGSAIEAFQFALITIAKFGTIGFFLISGFLLEKNLETLGPSSLIRRRIRKIFLPWTLWFVLTCVTLWVSDLIRHKDGLLSGAPFYLSLWSRAAFVFTRTSFWFVPNLLLSLMVLLMFRRYLQNLVFGGVLLATSLVYSLNIYTQWFDAHHTRAMFGFIFYLWLGNYAGSNIDRFSDFLRFVPTWSLWLATFVSALASFGEGRLLMHLQSVDPLNTLKVTTQVFSVLVFLCFFKYRRRMWPVSFDVPRTTFGMYLAHVIVLAAYVHPLGAALRWAGPHPLLGSFGMRVATWLIAATLTAATSLVLARALSHSETLGWTVGSPRRVANAGKWKPEPAAVETVA